MTWVLIGGVILIAAGCFAAGAACGPWLRSAWHRLAALLREAPPLQEHHGHHRAGTAPSALLTSEHVTAHADAMRQASEPYLPPSPAGEHPYPPYVPDPRAIPTADGEHVTCPACGFRDGRHNPAGCKRQDALYRRAGHAVEPVRTGEHPPWTGSQPVLDDEQPPAKPCHGCGTPLAESVLDWVIGYDHFFCTVECANGWAAEMDRVRYVRAQLAECGDRPTADDLRRVLASLRKPVYGEAPQAEVREAGRLAGVMLP